MTEMLFYHLQGQKLEGVLSGLLEKSLERGWKVIVQGASEERIDALDAHLWTYRDDGFLPHGTWREPDASAQPVLLTLNEGNPNGATVRFLINGAPVPGATVCAWKQGEAYAVARTNLAGVATLRLAADSPGTIQVSVSGAGLRVYRGTVAAGSAPGPALRILGYGVNHSPF